MPPEEEKQVATRRGVFGFSWNLLVALTLLVMTLASFN